jgi:hypothetical protein
VQNSFRDYRFLLISASLHTSLVQYYLLVTATEGKTDKCGLIAVLNSVNLGRPTFAVTHFQLSGRLGNHLAAFQDRQLTGFLVKYGFICATLNKYFIANG